MKGGGPLTVSCFVLSVADVLGLEVFRLFYGLLFSMNGNFFCVASLDLFLRSPDFR